MKLNKSERFVMYCIMLEEAENGYSTTFRKPLAWNSWNFGLCHLINQTFGIYNDNREYCFDNVTSFFPELRKKLDYHTPLRDELGWERRKAYLRECIEETSI